jgi:hypothetical protein
LDGFGLVVGIEEKIFLHKGVVEFAAHLSGNDYIYYI